MSNLPVRENLRECPFCGNFAQTYKENDYWLVECAICIAQIRDFISKEAAIKAWNQRSYKCTKCIKDDEYRTSIQNSMINPWSA